MFCAHLAHASGPLGASFNLLGPKWGILPTKARILTQVDPRLQSTCFIRLQIRFLEPHIRALRNGESGIHLEAFLRRIWNSFSMFQRLSPSVSLECCFLLQSLRWQNQQPRSSILWIEAISTALHTAPCFALNSTRTGRLAANTIWTPP